MTGTCPEREKYVNAYLRAGFALFPCTANYSDRSQGKAPAIKGWQRLKPDPLMEPADLPEVYGVTLPPSVVVLDVDPRRYVDNEVNELKLLWEQLELPSPQTVVMTGSGGFHIYYRKPESMQLLTHVPGIPSAEARAGLLGSALELKSAGRYVVGAGSGHFSGETYTLIRGNFRDLEEIPAALAERCKRTAQYATDRKAKARKRDEQQFIDNSQITRNQYCEYLKHAPEAIENAGGAITTYKVAAVGKDLALPMETTLELMAEHYNPRCLPPWDDEELEHQVRSAYTYTTGESGSKNTASMLQNIPPAPQRNPAWGHIIFDQRKVRDTTSPDGLRTEILHTVRNCINFMMMEVLSDVTKEPNPILDLVRRNTFTAKDEFVRPAPWHYEAARPAHWSDADTRGLRVWLSKHVMFNPTKELLEDAVGEVAAMNCYDPVTAWLDSLKWDGVARVDNWLRDYCGADDLPLIREYARLPIIGGVQRAYEPGSKFDTMLILQGPENTGKSTVVSILGGEWFGEGITIDPHNKDMGQLMSGKWFIEAAEMSFLKRTEIDAFKGWFTNRVDRVRPAYGRHIIEYPRRSVIIGTQNPDSTGEFLEDTSGDGTGNRRFCPVMTRKINLDGLRAVRDQLFAEAVYRYKNGENSYIADPELIKLAQLDRMTRCTHDEWEAMIIDRLNGWNPDCPLTTMNLFALGLGINAKETQRHNKRLARIMKRLGYHQVIRKHKGHSIRVWAKVSEAVTPEVW